MKHTLIAMALLAVATTATAGTDSDAVTLPEMRAIDLWHDEAVISHVIPNYPIEMRRAGIEGRVRVDILVDREGKVKRVLVLDTDNAAFADAVRDAVRRWHFVPATASARREHRHAYLTVRFLLEDTA